MKRQQKKTKPRNPIARELREDQQYRLKVRTVKKKPLRPITVQEATKILKEFEE